jgi:hypothetical protein
VRASDTDRRTLAAERDVPSVPLPCPFCTRMSPVAASATGFVCQACRQAWRCRPCGVCGLGLLEPVPNARTTVPAVATPVTCSDCAGEPVATKAPPPVMAVEVAERWRALDLPARTRTRIVSGLRVVSGGWSLPAGSHLLMAVVDGEVRFAQAGGQLRVTLTEDDITRITLEESPSPQLTSLTITTRGGYLVAEHRTLTRETLLRLLAPLVAAVAARSLPAVPAPPRLAAG